MHGVFVWYGMLSNIARSAEVKQDVVQGVGVTIFGKCHEDTTHDAWQVITYSKQVILQPISLFYR